MPRKNGADFVTLDKFIRSEVNRMGEKVLAEVVFQLFKVFMGVLMFVVAGLGAYTNVSGGPTAQGCVAAILIYQAIAGGCWGSCTWITTSEAAAASVRERTIMTATFVSFCMVLLITYVNPYVQDAGYGGLGAKVGFVYGGCSFLALIWTFFFLPELKGRSLEELDEMFEARVPTRKFGKYVCTGVGADITRLQDGKPTEKQEGFAGEEAEKVERV